MGPGVSAHLRGSWKVSRLFFPPSCYDLGSRLLLCPHCWVLSLVSPEGLLSPAVNSSFQSCSWSSPLKLAIAPSLSSGCHPAHALHVLQGILDRIPQTWQLLFHTLGKDSHRLVTLWFDEAGKHFLVIYFWFPSLSHQYSIYLLRLSESFSDRPFRVKAL